MFPENLNLPCIAKSKFQGLIRAKVHASRLATGEVIVFMDSHCEVAERWLEPLLQPIKEDPKRFFLAKCYWKTKKKFQHRPASRRPDQSSFLRLFSIDGCQEWIRLGIHVQMDLSSMGIL